jgi:hypothetical protein
MIRRSRRLADTIPPTAGLALQDFAGEGRARRRVRRKQVFVKQVFEGSRLPRRPHFFAMAKQGRKWSRAVDFSLGEPAVKSPKLPLKSCPKCYRPGLSGYLTTSAPSTNLRLAAPMDVSLTNQVGVRT